MTWNECIQNGLNQIINDYGEVRNTSRNSIVFPNGRVASIIERNDYNTDLFDETPNARWSVAVCDWNGYFDWESLRPFGTHDGRILCETEEDVASALHVISMLSEV